MKTKIKIINISLLFLMVQGCGAPFPTYDYSYPEYNYSTYNEPVPSDDKYCPEEMDSPAPAVPSVSPTYIPINREVKVIEREDYQEQSEDVYDEEVYEIVESIEEQVDDDEVLEHQIEIQPVRKKRAVTPNKSASRNIRKRQLEYTTPYSPLQKESVVESDTRSYLMCHDEIVSDRYGATRKQIVCLPIENEMSIPTP